jgi:hypothetical protein
MSEFGPNASRQRKPQWHCVDVDLADPRDHPNERLILFRSKLSMSEGSLTGRLSLWRGSWMASVLP